MISLRQHVVTIVAIFLALALGLLAGTAFVQPRLIKELQTRVDDQLGTINDLRSEVSDVRTQIGDLQRFSEAVLPFIAEGRLTANPVVIVAVEGVQDAVVAQAQRALSTAGANIIATLSVRARIASSDPADQRQLAQIIGRADAAPDELLSLAATSVAERLATPGKRPDPASPDLLHDLLSAGFLTAIGSQVSDATLEQVGGTEQTVVVLSGGPNEQPSIAPEAFAVTLVERLVGLGLPVAAGQSKDTALAFVERLRADGADGMVTVDDLDASLGGAALVLGLERLIVSGQGGAYGLDDGAQVLPPPS